MPKLQVGFEWILKAGPLSGPKPVHREKSGAEITTQASGEVDDPGSRDRVRCSVNRLRILRDKPDPADRRAMRRSYVMSHKFAIGQLVQAAGTRFADRTDGIYEIVRLMPESNGEFAYRIRNTGNGSQRAATESEIRAIREPATAAHAS